MRVLALTIVLAVVLAGCYGAGGLGGQGLVVQDNTLAEGSHLEINWNNSDGGTGVGIPGLPGNPPPTTQPAE